MIPTRSPQVEIADSTR